MNAKILISTQLISFLTMLGTAEHLFTNIIPTIIFITSLALFAKCSIYINKNEKRLLRECKVDEEKF